MAPHVLKGMRRWAALLLLLGAAARAGDRIEKRDHGKRTGKQSAAVSGHAISFEAPADLPFVRSVLVHGARYGDGYDPARTDFDVRVCDDKFAVLAKVAASYGEFGFQTFGWVEVPLPEPVRVPHTFRVVVDFAATETKGVYVGYGDVSKSHSSYFRDKEEPFAKGKEWMIRVRMSSTKEPLRRPPHDVGETLRKVQVPKLAPGDLRATLQRIAAEARVPVVLDGASCTASEIPEGSAAESLDRIGQECGVSWDVRYGVVYVAARERLERIPTAMPEPDAEGPTPPEAVGLRLELGRRRVDLECRELPLEQAVAQVANWLEFPVKWDPRVDRRQPVTVVAEGLRAHDALSLLLLPRGAAFRIEQRSIVVEPRTP